MAENPLATLARVLGGVVLMQGRLGHQVLGQLLVANTNEAAIAAASVVVTATSGQRSAVGQMLLRTLAPALAVQVLFSREERRLEEKAKRIDERERELQRLTTQLRPARRGKGRRPR